jgi:hypothetical protein
MRFDTSPYDNEGYEDEDDKTGCQSVQTPRPSIEYPGELSYTVYRYSAGRRKEDRCERAAELTNP